MAEYILTKDQIKRLVAARQAGVEYRDLATRFGISKTSAERYYAQHRPTLPGDVIDPANCPAPRHLELPLEPEPSA